MFNEDISISKLSSFLKERGLDDLSLISFYIPEFEKVGKPFNSTLRSDDNNASMRIIYSNGKLKISDFGLAGFQGSGIFGYVERKYNLTYQQTINKIYNDFINNNSTLPSIKSTKIQSSSTIKIEVKRRPFSSLDLEYWYQYHITRSDLKRAKIASLDMYWVTKDNERYCFVVPKHELAFVYPYHRNKKGIYMYKIYRPESDKYKWFSNIDSTVIQNFHSFDKSIRFIWHQSSLKDCIVMEVLGENNIIAPNAEGMWYNSKAWKYFNSNYSNIYFADNDHHKDDNPGITMAKNRLEKLGLEYVTTPNIVGVTDISDYIKNAGYKEVKEYVNQLKATIPYFNEIT